MATQILQKQTAGLGPNNINGNIQTKLIARPIDFVLPQKPENQFQNYKFWEKQAQTENQNQGKKLNLSNSNFNNIARLFLNRKHGSNRLFGGVGNQESKIRDSQFLTKLIRSLQEYDLSSSKSNVKSGFNRAQGLVNVGNTCYLNSVFQCLISTPVLQRYLIEGHHSKICSNFKRSTHQQSYSKNNNRGNFCQCSLCEFARLIKNISQSSSAVVPNSFIRNLKVICRTFSSPNRQQDAHEFLRKLMESFVLADSELSPLKSQGHRHKLNSISSNSHSLNFVQHVFSGTLRSRISCANSHCCNQSDTYEQFYDLSLEVSDCRSIDEALNRFFSVEQLDKNNLYKCTKCNRKSKSSKQYAMTRLPNILTIHLKRFQLATTHLRKVSKQIRFRENLSLSSYCIDESEKSFSEYSLYALIVHCGNSLRSGHYIAYIKRGSQWFCADDNRISSVSMSTVFSQQAYVLFYKRNALPLIKILSTSPNTFLKTNMIDNGNILNNNTLSSDDKNCSLQETKQKLFSTQSIYEFNNSFNNFNNIGKSNTELSKNLPTKKLHQHNDQAQTSFLGVGCGCKGLDINDLNIKLSQKNMEDVNGNFSVSTSSSLNSENFTNSSSEVHSSFSSSSSDDFETIDNYTHSTTNSRNYNTSTNSLFDSADGNQMADRISKQDPYDAELDSGHQRKVVRRGSSVFNGRNQSNKSDKISNPFQKLSKFNFKRCRRTRTSEDQTSSKNKDKYSSKFLNFRGRSRGFSHRNNNGRRRGDSHFRNSRLKKSRRY